MDRNLVQKSSVNKCNNMTLNTDEKTPHWPSANGEVERMNQTLKRAAQCADAEGKNWREELHKFLLTYRTTPHCITGVSLASLMFNHQMRNDIPFFDTICETKLDCQVNKHDAERMSKIKAYADKRRHAKTVHLEEEDEVLVKNLHKRNKLSTHYESKPYKVIKVYPSCKIQSATGATFIRNKAHLKKYVSEVSSKKKRRNGNVVRKDKPPATLTQTTHLKAHKATVKSECQQKMYSHKQVRKPERYGTKPD